MPKGVYPRNDKHRESARKALQSISKEQRIKNLGKWVQKGVMSANKGKKTGKPSWNRGITLSLETRKKMSESAKVKYNNGFISPLKGVRKMGQDNPNWKGGIRRIYENRESDYVERRRFQHTVQKQVFERDGYACVLGGKAHGSNLQVDHIQSWADYVDQRFNIENCRTLCMSCHYEITFGKPMPPTVRTWGHNLKRRSNL